MRPTTEQASLTALLSLWQRRSTAEVVQALCQGGQLTDADQLLLLQLLDEDPILQRFPPRPDYTRKLLKAIIAHCEQHGAGIVEEVLCRYAAGMSAAQPAGPWTHRTYLHQPADASADELPTAQLARQHLAAVNQEPPHEGAGPAGTLRDSSRGLVTLRVSDNMLAGGTGCHPWEAGFLLAELVLSHPEWFTARRCLELGCGSGLVGVALLRAGAATSGGGVLLTDGDHEALGNCRHNLALNGVAVPTCSGELSADAWQQRAMVAHLDWTDAVPQLAPDIILGADLLYDPEVVPALVALLQALLLQAAQQLPASSLADGAARHPAPSGGVAYLATKRRNEQTLQLFLDQAAAAGLVLEDVSKVARAATVRFVLNECLKDRDSILVHRINARVTD